MKIRRFPFSWAPHRFAVETVVTRSGPVFAPQVSSLDMMPLEHYCFVQAEQNDCILAEDYPEAEKVVLVTYNLNTHGLYALYEAFEPEQANRLARRLEWHFTPEHASWLNRAEIELSALALQALGKRIASHQELERSVCTRAISRKTFLGKHYHDAS